MASSNSYPRQQAYFIQVTDNGNAGGFGQEFLVTTFGPSCPGPIGAGDFGGAIWQRLPGHDVFTYSLVENPNVQPEPLGPEPPSTGQYITLDHVGVAAGASLTSNLIIHGGPSNEIKKIVVAGLIPGETFTAGSPESTTPL